jgi:hypothetical protein
MLALTAGSTRNPLLSRYNVPPREAGSDQRNVSTACRYARVEPSDDWRPIALLVRTTDQRRDGLILVLC